MIFRALNLWRRKEEKRSLSQRFMDTALLYSGTKYGWGKENLQEVDCSGLVSGAFILNGFPIRTTANEFLTKFFTIKTDMKFEDDKVKAIFFVAKENYNTPSGDRLAGYARHVGLLVGDGVIFSAVNPYAKFERIDTIEDRYDSSDMIVRELDWNAVVNDGGKYAFDPDLQ